MPNEDIELMNEFYDTVFDALGISYTEYLRRQLENIRNKNGSLTDILNLLYKLGADSIRYHAKDSYHRKATKYIMSSFSSLSSLEEIDYKLQYLAQAIALETEKNDLQLQELIKKMKESSNSYCNIAAENYVMNDKYLRVIAEIKELMAKLGEDLPGTSGRTGRGHI